jgi:hypothetical protein
MHITVISLLVLLAFALTLVSGITGKCPIWIAVLLLCIAELIGTVIR